MIAAQNSVVRTWDDDESYISDQNKDSSWSHDSAWGESAAGKFVDYGETIKRYGWLYHDDKVADFGGNDGYAAQQFFLRHGVKPLIVDCEPRRLEFARREYNLETLQCFIEDMPLADKSIDWGFCSHTLEHTRDIQKALSELARVIKRGCAFVFPMEKMKHAKNNPAHSVSCTTLVGWKKILRPDWIVKGSARTACRSEGQIFALPRKVSK